MKNDFSLEKLFIKYKFTFIWSASSLLLAVLLVVLVVLPQTLSFIKTNTLIGQDDVKLNNLAAKLKVLQSVDKDSYKSDIATTVTAMQEQRDLPASIDQLQILLTREGLTIESITFLGSGAPVAGLQPYQMKIVIAGSTDSVRDFINGLKNAPEIMKITDLNITGSTRGLVQDEITLSAYYYPPPKSIGTIDQPVSAKNPQDQAILDLLSKNFQTLPIISSDYNSASISGKLNPFQ